MPLSSTLSKIASSAPMKLDDWLIAAATLVAAAVAVKILMGRPSDKRRPPVVGSWLPWIGSDWAIDKDPDMFFKLAQEKYGGIYGARTAGWTFYYVTSTDLIDEIYKQPKLFHISLVQMHWGTDVFDFNEQRVLPLMAAQLGPQLSRAFAPTNMWPMIDAYDARLQQCIKAASNQLPSGSVPLGEWLIRLAYRATARVYFGDTFDPDDMWDEWKGFDEGVWKVALGYPPTMCPRFTSSREKVLQKFIAYLQHAHEACDLIVQHEETARASGFTDREIATIMVSDWWPLMASVPWGSLWMLILQMQRPEGVQPLIDELDAAGAAFMSNHPGLAGDYSSHLAAFFHSNPNIPLFSSTYSEVLRFTTDSYSMRGVLVESAKLGGYTFQKNDTLICRTRGVHQDPQQFDQPGTFEPRRFMSDDGGNGTGGVHKWMPYGGGISMCSGRHFAIQHVRITVATLLKTFQFEVDLKKTKLPTTLGNINRGFGIRRPREDFFVEISRV